MTFKPNKSGNPDGRPIGTGHRQKLFKALIEPYKDALIEKAINLALDGNEAMLRLFLERMLPPKPNDDTINIDIPFDLKKIQGVLESGELTLKAISEGTITPQQARIVLSALETQRKNIETSEIEERVAAIEREFNQRKSKEKINAKRQSK